MPSCISTVPVRVRVCQAVSLSPPWALTERERISSAVSGGSAEGVAAAAATIVMATIHEGRRFTTTPCLNRELLVRVNQALADAHAVAAGPLAWRRARLTRARPPRGGHQAVPLRREPLL